MDKLQLSQVHKTDKVTFIRQVPWCALVQSPSLSLQGKHWGNLFSPVTYLVPWLKLLPGWTSVVLPKLLAGDPWLLLYLSHENLLAVTPCFVLFPWPIGQVLGQLTVSWLPSIKSCKEYAQAVHTQRTLGWQLTLSLGLADTEFPMVKAPTEAKTFLLSVFVISSMALSILRWEV